MILVAIARLALRLEKRRLECAVALPYDAAASRTLDRVVAALEALGT
jgi:hypothetical protein